MSKRKTGWTYTITSVEQAAYGQNINLEIYSKDYNNGEIINGIPKGTLMIEKIFIPDSYGRLNLKQWLNNSVLLKIQLYLDRQNKVKLMNKLSKTQKIPVFSK